MKTSITISLLPSNPKMPFVLGPELEPAIQVAADLGYDAIELFPPSLDSLDAGQIGRLTREFQVDVSTIGTGGGAVSQGLTLTDEDPDKRKLGHEYVQRIIEIAGDLGASAIIGSMQGKALARDTDEVMKLLGDALAELGTYAEKWNRPLIYEPLNRYETDLANTLEDAARLLEESGSGNVFLLADLFHMNIEEPCVPSSIERHANRIGHVHFVDSNRWPAGSGHTPFEPIVRTLNQVGYDGFLAVEAFPLPNSHSAAANAMHAFRSLGIST